MEKTIFELDNEKLNEVLRILQKAICKGRTYRNQKNFRLDIRLLLFPKGSHYKPHLLQIFEKETESSLQNPTSEEQNIKKLSFRSYPPDNGEGNLDVYAWGASENDADRLKARKPAAMLYKPHPLLPQDIRATTIYPLKKKEPAGLENFARLFENLFQCSYENNSNNIKEKQVNKL